MHSESGSLTPALGGFACLGGLSLPTSVSEAGAPLERQPGASRPPNPLFLVIT